MSKHIYLTGFMGAGKSRIGLLLARAYNWPFYDTDNEVEELCAKPIRRIFEEDGEDCFRDNETKVLERLSKLEFPSVIALGGGALSNDENLKRARASGLIVYIKSAPEAIYERVKHSNKRPLLDIPQGPDFKDSLIKRIRELLDERAPVYEQSDIVFDRDGLGLEEIVDRLYQTINQKWG